MLTIDVDGHGVEAKWKNMCVLRNAFHGLSKGTAKTSIFKRKMICVYRSFG